MKPLSPASFFFFLRFSDDSGHIITSFFSLCGVKISFLLLLCLSLSFDADRQLLMVEGILTACVLSSYQGSLYWLDKPHCEKWESCSFQSVWRNPNSTVLNFLSVPDLHRFVIVIVFALYICSSCMFLYQLNSVLDHFLLNQSLFFLWKE